MNKVFITLLNDGGFGELEGLEFPITGVLGSRPTETSLKGYNVLASDLERATGLDLTPYKEFYFYAHEVEVMTDFTGYDLVKRPEAGDVKRDEYALSNIPVNNESRLQVIEERLTALEAAISMPYGIEYSMPCGNVNSTPCGNDSTVYGMDIAVQGTLSEEEKYVACDCLACNPYEEEDELVEMWLVDHNYGRKELKLPARVKVRSGCSVSTDQLVPLGWDNTDLDEWCFLSSHFRPIDSVQYARVNCSAGYGLYDARDKGIVFPVEFAEDMGEGYYIKGKYLNEATNSNMFYDDHGYYFHERELDML